MPEDRPWTDADRELVLRALCPGRNADVAYYDRMAAAVLDALTAAGWRPLTRAVGYHVDGRVYAPHDVMIVWEETNHA